MRYYLGVNSFQFIVQLCLQFILPQKDGNLNPLQVKDNGYEVTHEGKCITVFR